jgi:cell division protein FtsW
MPAHRNHMDVWTLVAVLLLMVLSLGVVYSASATWMMLKWGESDRLLGSHAVKVLAGFLAIFVFMQIPYGVYEKISKPVLIIAIVLLVATLLFGTVENGARRWLRLGFVSFQPADLARFALVAHLSAMMAKKGEAMRDWKQGFLPGMIWILLTTVFILLQPNRSTGAILFLTGVIMLFLGGARLSHIGITLGAGVPLLAAYVVGSRYGLERVMVFLRGFTNVDAMSHQLRQGLIGFGNGGIFGLGPGNSKQRDLFLPESYGDFVFSIVGEEYGFIGAVVIMGLFVLLAARGMRIAAHAPTPFGRNLALGISLSFALYAVVNAGVTLGILPTTGVPMPFVSYGGTSMIFSCAAVGVLLSISRQTDLYPRLREPAVARPTTAPAVGQVYK